MLWRPLRSERLLAELGGAFMTALLGAIGVLATSICSASKLWLIVAIAVAFVAFVLWRSRTPYCYLVADPDDLANPQAERINLWLIVTGYIPQVRCNISPLASKPGYNERYQVLREERKKTWTDIGRPDRMADMFVPVSATLDWRVEFTAGDNGWKEQITFKRRDDGTFEQIILLQPDAVLPWQQKTFTPRVSAPSKREAGVL